MENIKLGISIGDINGIGLEVIIKALSHPTLLNFCTPIIYGSSKILAYHKNIVKDSNFNFSPCNSIKSVIEGKVNLINCWNESVVVDLGKVNEFGGKYAYISLDKAVEDLKNDFIDALVTAPINKKAMALVDFPYAGHTQYITDKLDQKKSLMMMISDMLKVALYTDHVPVDKICSYITIEKLLDSIQLLNKSLIEDFGLQKPKIAILGLNPHASDEGTIGTDEVEKIIPAINTCKENGLLVFGPFAADGFFGSRAYEKYDAVLAMYHDQGLIPFKLLNFGSGVNYTAGLSKVRTSPDHGTGFDIVGKNIANEGSMIQAIFSAIDIVRTRREYLSDRADSLIKQSFQTVGIDRRPFEVEEN